MTCASAFIAANGARSDSRHRRSRSRAVSISMAFGKRCPCRLTLRKDPGCGFAHYVGLDPIEAVVSEGFAGVTLVFAALEGQQPTPGCVRQLCHQSRHLRKRTQRTAILLMMYDQHRDPDLA